MLTQQGGRHVEVMCRCVAGFSALRYIPLFADLDDSERRAVLAIATQFQVGKGHYLCEQGTPGDAVLVIEQGKARVKITDAQGKSSQVAMLGPGDVVGEMAFLDAQPRSADVVAMTPLSGYSIPIDRFNQLRAGQHPAAFKIMRRLALTVCGRLRKVNERVSQLIAGAPGSRYTARRYPSIGRLSTNYKQILHYNLISTPKLKLLRPLRKLLLA